jgi:hypothetical protein
LVNLTPSRWQRRSAEISADHAKTGCRKTGGAEPDRRRPVLVAIPCQRRYYFTSKIAGAATLKNRPPLLAGFHRRPANEY